MRGKWDGRLPRPLYRGFGEDTLRSALPGDFSQVAAFDQSPLVVQRARAQFAGAWFLPFLADCLAAPLPSTPVATMYSPSTLDHFHSNTEFNPALNELARVLEPGGLLLITLDHPRNPPYWALVPEGIHPILSEFNGEVTAAGGELILVVAAPPSRKGPPKRGKASTYHSRDTLRPWKSRLLHQGAPCGRASADGRFQGRLNNADAGRRGRLRP